MKKVLFLVACTFLLVFQLFAQSNIPQVVNFSAVVRDADNNLVVNTTVSLRLTFREGGMSGPLVYCALHEAETNQNGFISIQLNRDVLATGCNGAPSTAFENIGWENGDFWMEVEYQTQPGEPFENLGQLELSSSFYAFAAATAERLLGFSLDDANDGDILRYNISTEQWEASAPDSIGGFSGNYGDLVDAPVHVSAFENDMGYITEFQNLTVSLTGDTLYISQGNWIIVPGISAPNAPPSAPSVNTWQVNNITTSSAVCSGSIVSENNATVTERGFCWSTSPDPSLDDNSVVNGSAGGGSFNNILNDLDPGTEYFVRAYAINAVGIGYGNTLTFTSHGPVLNPDLDYGTMSDASGVSYATIAIGSQVWMAENLRSVLYSNGDSIPLVTNGPAWANLEEGAWCHFDNDSAMGSLYGKLYNGFAVSDPRGLCPAGWAIPSEEDWIELRNFVDPEAEGIENEASPALRSDGVMLWSYFPQGGEATNSSGFSALPGSMRMSNGFFLSEGLLLLGWFWSSTNSDLGIPKEVILSSATMSMDILNSFSNNEGLSVRCIQQ